ncbi:MAG: hypothetical protein J6R41_03550 [Paludibacteraceae bacterium]|nr:hypothetical protein [Paludibacteraceae bacterium]
MERYAEISTKMPREFLLLQGLGCKWAKCSFCDYHTDVSDNPFEVNRMVLNRVTGKYGVLDVINSGSGFELDEQTLELIKKVVDEKKIHTIWFEMHYMYRNRLEEFSKRFAPARVKFRCGIESFDGVRRRQWNKGVPADVTVADVAKHFSGVCLLVCTQGDTKERIITDIERAKKHFEYMSVNLFCNNGTEVRRDEELADWFVKEVYPLIKDDDRIEVLIGNTDLGVG